jgi:hypothetical protein
MYTPNSAGPTTRPADARLIPPPSNVPLESNSCIDRPGTHVPEQLKLPFD